MQACSKQCTLEMLMELFVVTSRGGRNSQSRRSLILGKQSPTPDRGCYRQRSATSGVR
jgi:hypothetical protein